MVSTAARVGSINVLLAVQFGQAVQGINTFANTVERGGQRTQRAVQGIDRSVMGMNRTMAGIASGSSGFRGLMISALRTRDSIGQMNSMLLATSALLGGLAPALTATYFVRMADRAQLLSNNLRTVTEDSRDLAQTQDALFDVAQRTRSSFESTATIYARTARATEHLAMSQAELLRMTETIQKAFAVGGATTAEAQGAAIQLSQGIASDRFSGEEFRSVAENAPVLLRGIAESLGVNIGKLREMAHAGELTAAVVTRAIIDASSRIDEEFNRTTSTIGQAMVRLDNAILKYVSDSENVSVASAGIVGAINMVTENVGGAADAILLLGGVALSVLAGRPLNALRQNTAAWGAHLGAVQQATAAAVAQAGAEARAAAATKASTMAAYEMAKANTVTASTRARLGKELQTAMRADLMAQKALVLATREHDAAMRAASISGRAYAAAGRMASAAWNFIGGGFGLALMAVGTAMYVISSESQKSQAELNRFAEAGDRVTETLARIEGRANETADGIQRLADGFRDLIQVEGFARAQTEINTLKDDISDMGRQLGELARQFSASSGSVAIGVQITQLTSEFRVGSLSVEDYTARLQELARANPDQSKLISDMIDVAEQVDYATPRLQEMIQQIEALDGKEANVTIRFIPEGLTDGGLATKGNRPGASPMDIAQEDFNQTKIFASRTGWDDYFNFPKERAPKKQAKERADEYERLSKRIAETTASMVGQTEVQRQLNPLVTDFGYALARAEAEMDLLNAAKEAGKEITPALRSEIAGLADQYGQATAEAARLEQEQRRIVEATEWQRDLVGSFIDDLRSAFEDGRITAQEWGEAFMNVLSRITDRLLNDVLDAIFQVNGAMRGGGGGGIFGFLGGLFGGGTNYGALAATGNYLFDSGGVHLGHGVVPFGPKTRKIGGGVLADSGLGPRHFPAVLEKGESVLTENDMGRTMDVISAATSRMGGGREAVAIEVFVKDDGTLGAIARREGQAAATREIKVYEKNSTARTARDILKANRTGMLK